MSDAPVQAGDVLAQKYRVDHVLGVGGMGVVVAATHLELHQRVALKFMLPAAFANPEALDRFRTEARAAVRLRSEHVARVLDTGTLENGAPYIVMEFLEGSDLAGVLKARGPLPFQETAEYIVQACDALAEAHALGIVHRDLKPANLFLAKRTDGSPLVKVLDFGISKANAFTEGGLGLTKTAAMMGSPLYMSPEQMKSSKEVDPRSDVWSLGVILYELLGGRAPFVSDTLGALMSMVMMEPHPPLGSVRPDLPRDLCALIDGCLEKDMARRVPNVAAVARGLAPFCPSRALPIVDRICAVIGSPPGGPPPVGSSPASSTGLWPKTVPPAAPSSATSLAQTSPPKQRGGMGLVVTLGSLAILAAGGAAAFVFLGLPKENVAANVIEGGPPPPASVATIPAHAASASGLSTSAPSPSRHPAAVRGEPVTADSVARAVDAGGVSATKMGGRIAALVLSGPTQGYTVAQAKQAVAAESPAINACFAFSELAPPLHERVDYDVTVDPSTGHVQAVILTKQPTRCTRLDTCMKVPLQRLVFPTLSRASAFNVGLHFEAPIVN